MSPKRVFIVHGFASSPRMYWFPWLKKELEKMGCVVEAPQMPNPLIPKIEEWVPYLAGIVGEADENTFFVGHSIGCQTIFRYLANLAPGSRVGGAVLVAPFVILPDLEKEIVKEWIETPLDFEKVKAVLPQSTSIFSTDDPLVPIENKEHFENRLGHKVIEVNGFNHFVTASKLPLALEELTKML